MLDLLTQWDHIAARLRSAARIALFLDFDGTLARFERRPEQVSLSGNFRRALIALASSPRFHVCVISGRRLADVRARVGVRSVRCLGLYGWESGVSRSLRAEAGEALASVRGRSGRLLRNYPGTWIEDKEHALAVHYSEAGAGDALRAAVEEICQPFLEVLRVQEGRKVVEVMPRELEDKGAAVRHQAARLGDRVLPVYVGDDRVDEPAFATLSSGVTIRVGTHRPTHARYRLSSIDRVGIFLRMLAKEFA